ncbi:hypothetical protein GOODEAATRI_030499 [Goodea atripinnis]|uniref:Uncharacterized protein n=1 Tax=Goodea atripinnis TaxID=208336 RepID=A0ABV0NHE7_9TELE
MTRHCGRGQPAPSAVPFLGSTSTAPRQSLTRAQGDHGGAQGLRPVQSAHPGVRFLRPTRGPTGDVLELAMEFLSPVQLSHRAGTMVGPRVCAQFGLLIPVCVSSGPPGVPPVLFWSQLQNITGGPPGPGRAWVTPTRMSRPNWAQTLGPTMVPLGPRRKTLPPAPEHHRRAPWPREGLGNADQDEQTELGANPVPHHGPLGP